MSGATSASAAPAGGAASTDVLSDLPPYFSVDCHPYTLLELRLIQLGGAIRDKREWTKKIRDASIVDKWTAEAKERGVPDDELCYALEENKYWAERFPGPVAPAAVPGVYLADHAIPEDLTAELRAIVEKLETEGEKDWHPGSDEQVLDLVHPSLYPLVFKTSLVLPENSPPLTLATCLSAIGRGTPAPRPVRPPADSLSNDYQWLPALFNVAPDGSVDIESYINNLHPKKYGAAYPVLARIFATLRPLFERVLTDLLNPRTHAINADGYSWYDPRPEGMDYEEWHSTRTPKLPVVPAAFEPPPEPTIVADLRGRKLQVIVKLANIHLTPEKPSYPGGSWHIEGMRNESIIATGIVYHSQDNVSESSLAFRTAVRDDFDYEQDDRSGVATIYGLVEDEPLNQSLGSVTSLPGRCVCFPNTLQHRVQPFALEDKTRPGHRKILVYWLVDPSREMKLTTANVPPQQIEWFKAEVFDDGPESVPTWLADIPNAARDVLEKKIDTDFACPYSLDKAKEYREALMKERKFEVDEQNQDFYERPVSLCEH